MNSSELQDLLQPIYQFLHVKTDSWLNHAKHHLDILLVDHANCELKAAQNAVSLLKRYALSTEQAMQLMDALKPYEAFVYQQVEFADAALKNSVSFSGRDHGDTFESLLISKMMRLIKEELHHFDQVIDYMKQRDIDYQHVPAGRYAKGLIRHVRHYEPEALIDKLIIGAIIEARSCERFAAIAPYLEPDLKAFYISLLRSEARHYQDYLELAQMLSEVSIEARVDYFLHQEADLILTPDAHFCFHSGQPSS